MYHNSEGRMIISKSRLICLAFLPMLLHHGDANSDHLRHGRRMKVNQVYLDQQSQQGEDIDVPIESIPLAKLEFGSKSRNLNRSY